jgi:hypothetical protein
LTGRTRVGGVLSDDTVWTKANNPYHLIADVQVHRIATLTISAGVRIIYDNLSDFEVLVKGSLRVQGTSEEPVIFDGSATTKNTNSMIKFSAANLLQSSIIHTQFIGPKISVELAEVPSGTPVNTGELILQYCIFTATQIRTGSCKCVKSTKKRFSFSFI